MPENVLYYGDNLDILHRYIKDETIDLIYLDPPFKSNQDYNVLFKEQNGSRSAAQIRAFEDTWEWNEASARAYQEIVEGGGKVAEAMLAFRTYLAENDMMAYLAMMAPRLIEMKRVLKKTGSIYLHCDPTASHYLKILMDAVFGPVNFKNEIVWCYETGGRATTSFPKKHDIILRYARTKLAAFYYDNVALPRDPSTMHEVILTDEKGRRYQRNIKGGKEYRYYLDRGVLPNDWWADIQALNPAAKERLGYPTQKPEALLERIIKASSDNGDIVLAPFCGCGTTIAVAQRLNRHWIGIDVTHLAIALMKHRIRDMFGEKIREKYKVVGEPVSLPDARTLAKEDPYQFQWWALGLVGARPVEQKKGADKRIDGRLYFHDEADSKKAKTKQIIFSVKSGHVSVSHVRDLRGVVEREKAQIGVLISMEKPTKPMRVEAASAGFYKSHWGTTHPVLQILTVEELLHGKTVDYPHSEGVNVTFNKAPKAKTIKEAHPELEYPEE